MWDCHFWWWVRALIFSLHRNLSPLFAAPCCQFSPSSGVVALGFAVVFNNEQVSCLFRPWFYNHFTRVNAADLRNPLGSVVLWGTPQWEWKCDWLIYGGREHTKQTCFLCALSWSCFCFKSTWSCFCFLCVCGCRWRKVHLGCLSGMSLPAARLRVKLLDVPDGLLLCVLGNGSGRFSWKVRKASKSRTGKCSCFLMCKIITMTCFAAVSLLLRKYK